MTRIKHSVVVAEATATVAAVTTAIANAHALTTFSTRAAVDGEPRAERISHVAVSAAEKSVLGDYKKLPPETKAAIAETLNALARTKEPNDKT